MGRRDFVFKWLFYALTALGFVLVQVFGLVHIRIWGVHPFLFPVLVSTVAALESAHESAVFALATGAVLDVTMPGVIPCHRVVNREGRMAPAFAFGGPEIQRGLLEEEGVPFLPDGRADLARALWSPGACEGNP